MEIFPDDTLGHVNDSDRPLLNQTVEMRIGPAATDTMGAMLWASTLSDASLEEIDKLLKDGEARRMLEEECEAKGISFWRCFRLITVCLRATSGLMRQRIFPSWRCAFLLPIRQKGPIGRVSERRPEFMIFIRCFPHCSRDSLIHRKIRSRSLYPTRSTACKNT